MGYNTAQGGALKNWVGHTMRNEKTALNQIAAEVKEKLNEYVDQWLQIFAEDIQKLDTFPTIDQLEETMITLDMETRRMFLEMLSQCLSNVDEKQVVSSKKTSSNSKE